MCFHHPVEGYGSFSGTLQFGLRTILLDIEYFLEVSHAVLDLFFGNVKAQSGEFLHFHDLQVTAERRTLESRVGIYIQHPAVVMAHQTQAIVKHCVRHARGFDPRVYFIPAHRIVVQHAGDLVEINA